MLWGHLWVQAEMRETTAEDFRYEDLERLGTDDLARITEWLTEKVDALSTRLKAEPKEDEVRGQLQSHSRASKIGSSGLLLDPHSAICMAGELQGLQSHPQEAVLLPSSCYVHAA